MAKSVLRLPNTIIDLQHLIPELKVKEKVKFTLEQATKGQGGVDVLFYSFLHHGARWGWLVVNATPRPLYHRERFGTHCIEGRVGLRAGLDGRGKSRLPQGFDPRTIQPVASRHTD